MIPAPETERPTAERPPEKVEVAVEVAIKYGAAIFVPDSIPPEKVEVADVVDMREPTERGCS